MQTPEPQTRLLAGVLFLFLGAHTLGAHPVMEAAPTSRYLVYFGTYTREASKGIYAYRFDAANGTFTSLGLAAETRHPSFLAIHPSRQFLYSVAEISSDAGNPAGGVRAFEIDPRTGKLKLLNQVSSRGEGPCHVNVDETGRSLVVANYRGGSVAAYPVNTDGSLGKSTAFVQHRGSSVTPGRQEGPHAHSVNFSPDNRFVFAADLGLDQILIYRFDPSKSSLRANAPAFARVAPGAGPRHFAFHPSGRYAYVINELASTVTAFAYDASLGTLEQRQTISTLPQNTEGPNSTAEVRVHPSGRFLYGSNRGHDSIVVFSIDTETGMLTHIENVSTQGKIPRNFGIDPSGSYLLAANQNSDTVVTFQIDFKTGRLTATGQVLAVPSPVCVRFVPLN